MSRQSNNHQACRTGWNGKLSPLLSRFQNNEGATCYWDAGHNKELIRHFLMVGWFHKDTHLCFIIHMLHFLFVQTFARVVIHSGAQCITEQDLYTVCRSQTIMHVECYYQPSCVFFPLSESYSVTYEGCHVGFPLLYQFIAGPTQREKQAHSHS